MNKTKKRDSIVKVITSFSVIIIVAVIVIELQKSSPDLKGLIQNGIWSIVCSIVASVIFVYMQRGMEDDKTNEMSAKLDSIEEKLKVQEELYDSGIKSVRKKTYYDSNDNFWRNILLHTDSRLDLTGRSISNWFTDEYKQPFCDKIKDMLNSEKDVHIVLSCEMGAFDKEKVKKAIDGTVRTNKLSKVETTIYKLKKILEDVDSEKYGYLHVYVTDKTNVTYLYIRTDSQCLISPYIFNSNNKSDTFLLELKTDVDYSRCFEDDFAEMIRNLDEIEWSSEI